MKKQTLDGGIEVITFDPPPTHFDPLTASPSDLVRYGFPNLADHPAHKARFQKVWGSLKNKFHYIQPTFKVNREKIHGPRKRKNAEGTETSGNWSGSVVYAAKGQSFKWLEGDWVVPNVDAPTAGPWYYCASWIGIDGDGSPDVFQAGVESEVTRNGTTVTTNFYPWWEWYPIPEVQITNFLVRPGDMVTMMLCSAQGAGSTTGTVFFTNRTTGASTSVGLTAPAGTTLAGNCAEWIVEAPTVGGSQSAVADYGEVFFSACEAVTDEGITINGGTGDNINMTANGTVVSDGNIITPTIVQCAYAGGLP
jgi:hypothetical protein